MPKRNMERQNLISEKTLQRYIYELISYGDKQQLNSLYPEKFSNFKEKTVKIIIPEFPVSYMQEEAKKTHYTDFRIVYTDSSYLNIEVEWKTSRFNHGKEVYEIAYQNKNGFIIVLENDSFHNRYIEYENITVLSAEDFSYWFLKRSKHIIDGTISNYVSDYNSRSQKYWVVFLPSKGKNKGDSLNDYKNYGRNKSKWAFRYSKTKKVMKNILNILTGDIIVFVFDFFYENGTKGRELYIDKEWGFHGLDILQIKNGYYCDLYDDTFEDSRWKQLSDDKKLNNKLYMHYINFYYPPTKISERYYTSGSNKLNIRSKSYNHYGWESFINKLRWSCTNQGAPAELEEHELNALYTVISNNK